MAIRFDRERIMRTVPFAVVAAVGQISATWPPGPQDYSAFWLSTALLFVSASTIALSSFTRPSPWMAGVCIYVASVALLMLATGGVASGLGSLLLLAAVGVALYGRHFESAVVVAAVMLALFCVSLAAPHDTAETARRVVLFGSTAVMLSVAIQGLRHRLGESNARTTRLLEQAEAINAAARQLATLLDPPAITSLGTELAARIAAPSGSDLPCALYYRLHDGMAIVDARFEPSGENIDEHWPIEEDPHLRRSVDNGVPVLARIDPRDLESSAHVGRGTTHGMWVPVRPGGSSHGVLFVGSRSVPISEDGLERCVALGHLLELALSNWAMHQRLEKQATAEERRRIARELHDGLAHELAFIASKTRRRAAVATLDARELACAADRALDEARRAITVLSSSSPQPLGQAVAQTAEDLGARLEVAVHLDLAEELDMPGDVTENLLRILREAITNAANHGHADKVTVRLEDAGGVHLVVEDDGCGFDVDNGNRSSGFGLLSMEERAISVGAHFSIESSPDHGTRVEVAFS